MNENKKGLLLLGIVGIFLILIVIGMIMENMNSKKVLDTFIKYYNSEQSTLVLIGKEECSYCKAYHPELDFMSEHYGFDYEYIDVEKLNSTHYNKLLEILDVEPGDFGTPYTVVVQKGKKIDELAGAVEEQQLLQFLKDNNFVTENEKLLINYIDYTTYEKVLRSENPQIIAVGKTSCIYCKMVKATLNKIIKKYGININYLNLDGLTEENLNSLYTSLDFFATENWGTPSFLIVQDEKLLGSISGMQAEETFITTFKEYGLIEE